MKNKKITKKHLTIILIVIILIVSVFVFVKYRNNSLNKNEPNQEVKLVRFSAGKCEKEIYNYGSKKANIEKIKETNQVSVKLFASNNCCSTFDGKVESSKDKVELKIIRSKEGCFCNCNYNFSFILEGVDLKKQDIFYRGKKLTGIASILNSTPQNFIHSMINYIQSTGN